jgi:hypothetical protein
MLRQSLPVRNSSILCVAMHLTHQVQNQEFGILQAAHEKDRGPHHFPGAVGETLFL